jgi:RNA polymerase sigma factor (sigma-70 family)
MSFTGLMVRTAPLPPFQELLDSHAQPVLRFLRGAVGPGDADDCFQETFLAALRAYPGLEHGAELRAWLMTIARNKALDHHRATARRPRPVAEPPEPRSGNGHATADQAIEAAELWSVVSSLPEGQRSALALRYAGGLRYREVAAALGCSEDAARRRVADGLKSLRLRSRELEELVR